MRNITKELRSAINCELVWCVNEFYIFMEAAERASLRVTYPDDEENWGYIGFDDEHLCYIWRKYPLILIESHDAKHLEHLLTHFPFVVVIVVNDLGKEDLIIDFDQDIMERLGGVVNYDQPISASIFGFIQSRKIYHVTFRDRICY